MSFTRFFCSHVYKTYRECPPPLGAGTIQTVVPLVAARNSFVRIPYDVDLGQFQRFIHPSSLTRPWLNISPGCAPVVPLGHGPAQPPKSRRIYSALEIGTCIYRSLTGVLDWGATPVTGVHCIDHEISRMHPSHPDMQNLVGVEISALKYGCGALQSIKMVVTIFQNFTGVDTNYLYSTKVRSQSRQGYTIFLKFLWCAPRCTLG